MSKKTAKNRVGQQIRDVYIGASEKMLDDLIDLPLNLPDDKIIKYHREDFLKDEE